jgi:transposase-like protein
MKKTIMMERTNQQQEAMFALIGQWQASDKTQKEFCRLHDIAYHVFHYWYKKYRQQAGGGSGGFVPVQINSSPRAPWMSLCFSDGKQLHLYERVEVDFLRRLLSLSC